MSWLTPLPAEGESWSHTSTEEYGAMVFRHWRCRKCKRTAVTAGERKPSACCCEAKR